MVRNNSIATKIILYVIGANLIMAIAVPLITLTRNYQNSKIQIEKKFEEIEETIFPVLAEALSNKDKDQVQQSIYGILNTKDMVYLEIFKISEGIVQKKPLYKGGMFQKNNTLSKKLIVTFLNEKNNKMENIAKVHLTASLNRIQEKVREQITILSLIIGIQFILLSLVIYFILNRLISRHLETMANYAENLDLNDLSDTVLKLEREESKDQDELDKVVISFNKMKENLNTSHVQLKEYAKNLTLEIQNKSEKIEKQYIDFKNLLFNLDQGFLIFDKEGKVISESTVITKDLFQTDPMDKNIEDILKLGTEEKKKFKNWLLHIFKGVVPFKDLTPLAPKVFNKIEGKIISLDYKPVFSEKNPKKINKVICIATDVTEKVSLEKKALIEKEKAQRLTNILYRPLEFLDLIGDADEVIEYHINNLRKSRPDSIFRSFHNLKAQFAVYKINEVVQNIHDLEDFLNEIEDDWNDQNIINSWVLIEKIQTSHYNFVKDNRKLLEVANNSVNSNQENINPKDLMETFETFISTYHKKFVLKEASTLFHQFISPIEELAQQQDKLINISIVKSEIFIDVSKYKNCFSTFIHIFRNSIDHGIESIDERVAKNKNKGGLLEISIKKIDIETNGSFFKVIIKDDGKGIDPEMIKEVVSKKENLKYLNLENLSDRGIIQVIFEPGFSSKEEVSKISGRGVGMDSVKTEVENMGGSIKVLSKVDQGTIFEILLPLIK